MTHVLDRVRSFNSELALARSDPTTIKRYDEWRQQIRAKDLDSDGLRVLILLSQQPGQTGSGVSTREMMQEMMRQGHNPNLMAGHYHRITGQQIGIHDDQIHTVLFTPDEEQDRNANPDLSFKIPGMSNRMPYPNTPFRDLTEEQLVEYFDVFYFKIQQLVETLQPDVLHINHLWFLPPIAQLAVPWLPIVATVRGTGFLLLSDRPSFGSLVIEGARSLDAVTAISPDIGQRTTSAYGIAESQIDVIPNGYDDQAFFVDLTTDNSDRCRALNQKFNLELPLDATVVLAVGKFVHWKGLEYLIRAAAEYSSSSTRRVVTVIVGNGNIAVHQEYQKLIDSLELNDSVFLIGKIDHAEVAQFMNLADILVAPSIYEAFGRVVLEALATGLRVVASDVGGIPSIIDPELCAAGLATLVRPVDADSTWQADPNDEERFSQDLGEAIRVMAQSKTTETERRRIAASVVDASWRSRAVQIVDVYRKAIQARLEAT